MCMANRISVTREDVEHMKRRFLEASRYELVQRLGCSEQTVQRRIEGNNVRGGKNAVATKVLLTGCMLAEWAEDAGLYLYDQRIWHKDPCWANSRWHFTQWMIPDPESKPTVYNAFRRIQNTLSQD